MNPTIEPVGDITTQGDQGTTLENHFDNFHPGKAGSDSSHFRTIIAWNRIGLLDFVVISRSQLHVRTYRI